MSRSKQFKLGGLYQLTIGDIYEDACLKDIKQQLESIHGVKLQKAATQNQLIFICKNGHIKSKKNILPTKTQMKDDSMINQKFHNQKDSQHNYRYKQNCLIPQNKENSIGCNCGYFVRFIIQFRIKRSVYKLQNFNLNHHQNCYNPIQATFLRNRRELTLHSALIIKIINDQLLEKQQRSNPMAILGMLCEQIGVQIDYFYKGIQDTLYKRKMKKKLDNIIADAKKTQTTSLKYILSQKQFFLKASSKNISNTSIQAPKNIRKPSVVSIQEDQKILKAKKRTSTINSTIKDSTQVKSNKKVCFENEDKSYKRIKLNQEYADKQKQHKSSIAQQQNDAIMQIKTNKTNLVSNISLIQSSEIDPTCLDEAYFLFPDYQSSVKDLNSIFQEQNICYDINKKNNKTKNDLETSHIMMTYKNGKKQKKGKNMSLKSNIKQQIKKEFTKNKQ